MKLDFPHLHSSRKEEYFVAKVVMKMNFRVSRSPFLEGLWQFKWIGAGSPGQFAARVLLKYDQKTFYFVVSVVQA